MTMRKYGSGDGRVTEVEPDQEAPLVREAAAAKPWSPEDEQDLQEETNT